jgi:N-acetylmuramic acid 6-phosphate etherase
VEITTADDGVFERAARIGTEQRNPASLGLDEMSALEVLELLNTEDGNAVAAVRSVLPQLASLVEAAAERVRAGGRVHYFGAGTSGRLAVLDAAELLPTFNLPDGVVIAHIAGGDAAVTRAVENAEDSREAGAREAGDLGPDDVAIGITASGMTPYVGGALEAARANGALTALVACNADAALAPLADIPVLAVTGPEVLSGSTRLKAGTAEKLILNGFSTALMVALGRTWSNLMVSVVATNEKLRARTTRILMQALEIEQGEARELLESAGGDLKAALVAGLASVEVDEARSLLEETRGSVRDAIARAVRS